MLIVTGTLPKKGTSVVDHIISAKEFMEEFGIPAMGAHTEFELMPTFQKKDPTDGTIQAGRQQSFSPVYDLYTPSGTVKVRYAEGREPQNGGGYKYTVPNNRITEMRGIRTIFRKGEKIEIYAWMYMHPRNASNPYRDQQKQAIYRHVDREAEAKLKIAKNQQMNEVRLEIMEMDGESLRVMAAGLDYKVDGMTQIISNLDSISVAELRLELFNRSQSHGQAFYDAWRSGNNTLNGMLQYAVDRGVIKMKKVPGSTYWAWNTDTHKDVLICLIRAGEPEMAALRLAFAENYGELFAILNAAINKLRTEDIVLPDTAKLDSKEGLTLGVIQGMGLEWILEQAEMNDVVALDRTAKKVRFLSNGEYTSDFMDITDLANWRQEVIANLSKGEYKPQRGAICTRLFHKLNPGANPDTVVDVVNTPAPEPVIAAAEPVAEPVEPEEEPIAPINPGNDDEPEPEYNNQ